MAKDRIAVAVVLLRVGFDHRFVGTVQIIEMVDEGVNACSSGNTSSMWWRAKSVRLPTDFIDTVWWNSSSA